MRHVPMDSLRAKGFELQLLSEADESEAGSEPPTADSWLLPLWDPLPLLAPASPPPCRPELGAALPPLELPPEDKNWRNWLEVISVLSWPLFWPLCFFLASTQWAREIQSALKLFLVRKNNKKVEYTVFEIKISNWENKLHGNLNLLLSPNKLLRYFESHKSTFWLKLLPVVELWLLGK